MVFLAQKQTYLKILLGFVVVIFAAINTVGMLGSTEMQEAHQEQSSSLGLSLASTPDSSQMDHLEDLVAWDDFGSASWFVDLAALAILLLAAFSILPRFKLFTSDAAQFLSSLYTKQPAFSFALQEAFSRGIINGKVY